MTPGQYELRYFLGCRRHDHRPSTDHRRRGFGFGDGAADRGGGLEDQDHVAGPEQSA